MQVAFGRVRRKTSPATRSNIPRDRCYFSQDLHKSNSIVIFLIFNPLKNQRYEVRMDFPGYEGSPYGVPAPYQRGLINQVCTSYL